VASLSSLPPALLETNIPDFPKRKGKVRDTYDLGDKLLMVATDRISTFDVVHPTGIPDKGKILTSMTLFWFKKLQELIPDLEHHLISDDVRQYGNGLDRYADQLEGRSMLVHKANIFPIECIARGYITGSGWKDYQKSGAVCGIELPSGMQQCQKLPSPIFTPSTKAEVGNDENITIDEASARVGRDVMECLDRATLLVYRKAAEWAESCGILLADTKLEWGEHEGRVILADEVLTPDSSRFWPADRYQVGRDQESFDKQYVRNFVQGIGWDKKAPAPELPPEVVLKTREKYMEAHDRITGSKFVNS
jgi:phosphoribosylaminoimidazole-succinocarboxamide synthase